MSDGPSDSSRKWVKMTFLKTYEELTQKERAERDIETQKFVEESKQVFARIEANRNNKLIDAAKKQKNQKKS